MWLVLENYKHANSNKNYVLVCHNVYLNNWKSLLYKILIALHNIKHLVGINVIIRVDEIIKVNYYSFELGTLFLRYFQRQKIGTHFN